MLDPKAVAAPGVARTEGTIIFICPDGSLDLQPLAHFLRRNPAIPERVVLVRLLTEMVPHVAEDQRAHLEEHDHGVCLVTLLMGYDDEPDVPDLLRHTPLLNGRLSNALYCLARPAPSRAVGHWAAAWQRGLRALLGKIIAPPESYLHLPADRTLVIDRAGDVLRGCQGTKR